jgi:hypothetical protein
MNGHWLACRSSDKVRSFYDVSDETDILALHLFAKIVADVANKYESESSTLDLVVTVDEALGRFICDQDGCQAGSVLDNGLVQPPRKRQKSDDNFDKYILLVSLCSATINYELVVKVATAWMSFSRWEQFVSVLRKSEVLLQVESPHGDRARRLPLLTPFATRMHEFELLESVLVDFGFALQLSPASSMLLGGPQGNPGSSTPAVITLQLL